MTRGRRRRLLRALRGKVARANCSRRSRCRPALHTLFPASRPTLSAKCPPGALMSRRAPLGAGSARDAPLARPTKLIAEPIESTNRLGLAADLCAWEALRAFLLALVECSLLSSRSSCSASLGEASRRLDCALDLALLHLPGRMFRLPCECVCVCARSLVGSLRFFGADVSTSTAAGQQLVTRACSAAARTRAPHVAGACADGAPESGKSKRKRERRD